MFQDRRHANLANLQERSQMRVPPQIHSRQGLGYMPKYPRFHVFFNRALGSVLLLCALPVLAVIAAVVLILQGRPLFYGGPRLGKNGVPFQIYKFRTLDSEKAKLLTSNKVLPRDSNIETPFGKFLRASRLDELAQLWNVVRGDMNLVGPRPVRHEIAAIELAKNPHYEIRFLVKPGLVGPAQAFMCHGTSKGMRAKYNYGLCCKHVSYSGELALLFTVAYSVLVKTIRLTIRRLLPANAQSEAVDAAQAWSLKLELPNGQTLPVNSFEEGEITLSEVLANSHARLSIQLKRGKRFANVFVKSNGNNGQAETYLLSAADDYAEHIIGRYLMDDPVVTPKPPKTKRQTRDFGWQRLDRRFRRASA